MSTHILLTQDFYAEEVSHQEWIKTFSQYVDSAFQDTEYIFSDSFMEEAEKLAVTYLFQNLNGLYRLCFTIKRAGEIVGWSAGRQADKETFNMVNSAILPAYRGKGIYSSLLPYIINKVKDAGFQKIDSFHHPTNNAIIIPKLRKGFFVTGLEVEDEAGMRLRLTYYFNEKRRHLVQARTGALSMNPFI